MYLHIVHPEGMRAMKRYLYLIALITPIAGLSRAHASEHTTYFVTNAQGTVVAEMDQAGNVTYSATRRPYGHQQTGTPQDGPSYTGHVNDIDTSLTYMQARYYDPLTGRFLSADPIDIKPGDIYKFNRFDYANNNPIINIDPTGKDVFVDITRKRYTNKSVISTIKVTSDKTKKSFTGYTLENAKAGDAHNKPPIPQGKYKGHTRSDGSKGWRIELNHVKGYKHIEIHVGNFPQNVKGCFAAGTNAPGKNFVTKSKMAMGKIKSVVDADGTGNIEIQVYGNPTQP
jgi:RHS repeat-associated protein